MAYTEFYVTKGSAASDLNGGGPSLGTNDGPVDAVTDAVATHSAGGAHTIASTAQFVNAAVDDFVCWDADGTPQWGVITSKTSSSVLAIQRVDSAAAFSVLSPTKVNVGGAWATIQGAHDELTTSFVNAAGDHPRVNIHYAGGVSYDEQVTLTYDGTAAIPMTYEGYYSTPGDECDNGGTPALPIIDGTGLGGSGTWHGDGANYNHVKWLKIIAADANQDAVTMGYLCYYANLHLKATGTGAIGLFGNWGKGSNLCFNVHVEDSASHGFQGYGVTCTYINCVSLSAGGAGFDYMSACTLIGCIADGSAYEGFEVRSGTLFYGCIARGAGYDSFSVAQETTIGQMMIGCISESPTSYGIDFGALNQGNLLIKNMAYYNSGTADTNGVTEEFDAIALTASPFVDAANGDFNLNNVEGGGRLLRSVTQDLIG